MAMVSPPLIHYSQANASPNRLGQWQTRKLNLRQQPLNLITSCFFGDGLASLQNQSVSRLSTAKDSREGRRHLDVVAKIKRRKDPAFDKVIDREKKLKIVSRVKELVVREPERIMSLRRLGKYRKQIGLIGKRRFIVLLRRYPAVFRVFEEGASSVYFKLTPQAEAQYLEELKIKQEMEEMVVNKLRKILMMSIDKRILLSKIKHLKRDLGLPDDFDTVMVNNYPGFFKVVQTGMGPALELTSWDPALAISALEKKKLSLQEQPDEITVSGRPPRFPRISLPRGLNLSRKDKEKLIQFDRLPFVSPYSDFSHLDAASPEAEKHAVAVVHELLTLTIEKRTLTDHLTHFRKDYKFSQRLHPMVIRHPEHFYISLKGQRDSIFLREAYHNSELIEKDPLVLVKEKLAALISVGRNVEKLDMDDAVDDESDDEDDGEWSDDEVEGDQDIVLARKDRISTLKSLGLVQKEFVNNGPPREIW